jgi:hypothetical protein
MNNLPPDLIDPQAFNDKKAGRRENGIFIPKQITRFVQSSPIPIPLVAQVCEEYKKLGWEVAHVLPFGLMKVSSLALSAAEQNIPAFVIILCKDMDKDAKIELPEVKIGGKP